MANKSIYETSFAAGKTGGEYEASLQEVGDVWSDIESSRAMTAAKGERRGQTLDAILAATELTGQVAGGMQKRQEFQSSLKQVAGSVDPSGKTKAVKVGKGGQSWGELNPLEKLFQKPEYQFGEGVQMSKADITTAGQMLQYGGEPDYTRFKPESMEEEVGGMSKTEKVGQFGRDVKTTLTNVGIDIKESLGGSKEGKFYGEKRGFDIGDIVGEKSVFAAGKQKFSSVLSSAQQKMSSLIPKKKPPSRPEAPKLGIEDEKIDILGEEKVGKETSVRKDWQSWEALESTQQSLSTPPPVDEYQSYTDYAKNIGKKVWNLLDWND